MVKNLIRVNGRVGRFELRFTPQGTAVANMSVAATDSHYDKSNSTWVDHDPMWYEISLFAGEAEKAAEMNIEKGDHLIIDGELSQETYTKSDGTPGSALKIKRVLSWGWQPKAPKKNEGGNPEW